METYEEYLSKKKIDSEAFQEKNEALWNEWKNLFQLLHPDSFTAQKLFLINQIRRQFPAKEASESSPK